LGAGVGDLRKALEAGEYEALPDGGFRAAGHDLTADEVLVERTQKDGWAVASTDGVSIALDTTLDDELLHEGRVYDAIHAINSDRKELGLALTDRIRLTLPASSADLLSARDWIAAETLADVIEVGTGSEIVVERV
jgi:isoleucyl-tRNA synthetase